jgi:hypothetical protein
VSFPDGRVVATDPEDTNEVMIDLDAFALKIEEKRRDRMTETEVKSRRICRLATEFVQTWAGKFDSDDPIEVHQQVNNKKREGMTSRQICQQFGVPDALVTTVDDAGGLWSRFLDAFIEEALPSNDRT